MPLAEIYEITVFNKATRVIRGTYRSANLDLLTSQVLEGEFWVLGKGDPHSEYIGRDWQFHARGDGGKDDPGAYEPPEPVLPVIDPDMVKAEAARRLTDLDWRVEKAEDEKDTDAEAQLREHRQFIRERSNAIEAMSPIPHDYTDDLYWTVAGDDELNPKEP